ncbi:MAG: hypothetical protein JWQ01_1155 [Massilia sp.]|nr:hypothetical protein [Massilia sp.]
MPAALRAKFDEFRNWSALAQRQTGKSALTQFKEIRALRGMGGQCGVSDYYWYKLYDDNFQAGRGARDFLGWRLQQSFSMALNPRHVVLPAWDKLVFMTLAGAAGLPVAPLRAYYHRARVIPDALGEHLATPAAAAAFLRDGANFPLFAKPAYSQQGVGCDYLASYDGAADSLVLLDGATIGVDQFVQRLSASIDPRYHRPECGFVFQQPLTLAPELRALTNWTAICGARVICLNGPDGIVPILGLWKIANEPNYVDNFSKGAYGNLMGYVDVHTGVVTRMLGGLWPNTEVIVDHPRTGARLEGLQLPGWERVLEICRQGGAAFPLMKIHHWDFALTDRGPVILELNDLGGTIGSQLYGHGLLTEDIRGFLRRHASPAAHPWIKSL